MGFSLSRALAGGVAGAAGAAGQVFDAQLKEAAIDRARVADEERAFRVADHADELAAMREQRKQEYGDLKEKNKRADYASTVKDQMALLKEKGIAVGSAQGQFAIAEAFLQKGQPEFANTFTDNGQKAQQADDNKELRKIQLANAAATSALARQGRADAREAKIGEGAKLEYGRYKDIINDFDVKTKDADNNVSTDSTLKHWMESSVGSIATKDPYKAVQLVSKMATVANDVRSDNPAWTPRQVRDEAEKRMKPPAPAQLDPENLSNTPAPGWNSAPKSTGFSAGGLLKKFFGPSDEAAINPGGTAGLMR